MDPSDWHALLHAQKSDPVRQWATLEGKSPTMRDDLYRRCWQAHERHLLGRPAFSTLVDLGTWLHVALSLFDSQ